MIRTFSKLFLLLFFFTTSGVLAQKDQTITGSFQNIPFTTFVQQLKEETGYRFFFDPAIVDSLVINVTVSQTDLRTTLNQALTGTNIHYTIDHEKNVFLTESVEIIPLPDGFFGGSLTAGNRDSQRPDYQLEADKKEDSKIQAESKLYDIGKKTAVIGPGTAVVSGYIKAASNGEPIIGASIYIEQPLIGASTDQFGFYNLTIPKGKHDVLIKSIGMKSTVRKVTVYSDGKLNVELVDDVTTLKEIIVESEKGSNIANVQMGMERLDIKTIKKIPVVLGEVDILKVMLTLPGVQSVGEGTSGLNVRGGATDQNLILFDDAVIYNPAHLFGFFSAFNPDVVKNVELHKSGIPAEFGGRISSVLDVTSREGNKKKYTAMGGIGLITSRLTFEGPIVKDKGSFLIAGRSTYSDWLLKQIPTKSLKNSEASFYDFNVNADYAINDKNTVYLNGYMSHDAFKLNSDTVYGYNSTAASVKWKHSFTNKLYSVLTGTYSNYDYQINSEQNPVNGFSLLYRINQKNAKIDFNYFPMPKHTVNFGVSAIHYLLEPGSLLKAGEVSEIKEDILSNEQGVETAAYISDQYEVTPRLSIYLGLRYSHFNNIGPGDVRQYRQGETKSESSIQDTISYASGKTISRYHGPEYRFSAKYSLAPSASLKLSYNRTRQYIHMLSNTTAISPTDIWKLSDPYLKPQVGDQFSFGFYKNFRSNSIETSAEAYYKTMENVIDYKGGAKLLLNHHVETDVIRATGRAYGIELLVKKMNGKVNGWISYTYSRSLLQTTSDYSAEIINNGKFYPSNYDKPHAVNLIGNYKFSHRLSASINAVYSTGRPITIPIAKYYIDGSYRTLYGPRNGHRIPDYFRIDFSLNIEGNHKIKKLAHGSWTVGVYNVTGRRNAYSVFFESKEGVIKGYKLSVLGSPIPTVTYNFKF